MESIDRIRNKLEIILRLTSDSVMEISTLLSSVDIQNEQDNKTIDRIVNENKDLHERLKACQKKCNELKTEQMLPESE